LIPIRKKASSGRLGPSPFEFGSTTVFVAGAVVRGVAVAPSTPPREPIGDGVGVPFEEGAALGAELGAELGPELGPELGGVLGLELGGVLELGDGDGQAGTVWLLMMNPSENVIR